MTANDNENELEIKVIRALVIARGRGGANLQEIKNDYIQEVGKKLRFDRDSDFALRQWIEKIPHIRTIVRDGQIMYISEAPEQEHLSKLIRHQKGNKTRQFRKPQKGLHTTMDYDPREPCLTTSKTWSSSLVFRRSKLANSSFNGHQNSKKETFKQPYASNQTFYHQNKPHVSKRSLPMDSSSVVGSARKHTSNFPYSDEDDFDYNNNNKSRNCNEANISGISNVSCVTDRIVEEVNHDPFKPEFFKCIVVGDNFFLNLVMMNMGFRMILRNHVMQSGYCVSGQTIDEAASQIEQMESNQLILLNIGSVDIIKGKELIELVISMMRLLKVCKLNEITPVLTTLLPIANHRIYGRTKIMNDFNSFLLKNPFEYPVIDLHKTFIKKDGTMDPNCYKSTTSFVSGFKKPIVLWNSMGRQKIMKVLKQEIGSAFLKILLK